MLVVNSYVLVGEDSFNPTLKIVIEVEIKVGSEVLINAFGDLNYHGKKIGRLEPSTQNVFGFPLFAIKSELKDQSVKYNVGFECKLDKNVLKYISDGRKAEKNGDVVFIAEIRLIYLENRAYIIESRVQTNLATNNTANMLSTLNGTSYLEMRTYNPQIPMTIKSSDWINDFAPKLGLGEYEIIEIPRLNAVNIKEKFSNSLSALEVSRKYLYSLNNGSAMSSLRNSLREFNEALKNLGYRDENGKNVDYGKIFDRNKNNEILVETLQKNLYSSSSRGEEPAAAHMGNSVEGYEIESMIFMTYSLYKMVFEKLREKEESEGD
ncbi:hypothetical protein [Cuniculiplasma divulgatum]|jgi:hypothetical protein|uniref:Uncharacterized protein n=1 Tax=Cuniculiplasma divulgatum TaxID=1673428 RepID=A0A1N5TND4_9ARCH|nr:hypothetical protein [Cuniculiplasma divulgatum]MCL6015231.1 hypothetical protein [Candidatus Thermoplasmatota archaeon]OWP54697.1 MAG: hypothetical protein B2I18_05530 [Cuniculiplasma sp. C_DKE]WMT48792.1 MAG: hypothetical protein RE472_06860 [Thermoplasmatales archaeon]SIM49585.1 hypothetical protein CSP5_0624 [Cuniculiplasma divulgatum]SJK84478.1 hypothetical protein CPM_0604 [Cuniculiplasma divulgatum]